MARSIIVLAALAAAAAVSMPAAAKDRKVSHSDIQVTKHVDRASPLLYRKKATGGVKNQEYMSIKMDEAFVSSRRTGASGAPPTATPLTATSSGLLQSGGGGTVGGSGATKVRHSGPTAH